MKEQGDTFKHFDILHENNEQTYIGPTDITAKSIQKRTDLKLEYNKIRC